MKNFNYKNLGRALFVVANLTYISTAVYSGIETERVYMVKGIANGIATVAILVLILGVSVKNFEITSFIKRHKVKILMFTGVLLLITGTFYKHYFLIGFGSGIFIGGFLIFLTNYYLKSTNELITK